MDSLQQILALKDSPAAAVEYAQRHGLMASSIVCRGCGSVCVLRKSDQSKDGCVFRCRRKGCKRHFSVRFGSWFSGARLELWKILFFVYSWVHKMDYAWVKSTLSFGSETMADYRSFCREICVEYLEMLGRQRIGGPGVVVEIDESKFGKRKYHRGRRIQGQWVVAGVERGPNPKMFFCPVDKRDKATLSALIVEHVLPGSTIHTDLWGGYVELESLGYTHLTVNHSENFVDPHTGAHTQRIESMWNAWKRSFPRSGVREGAHFEHFCEYYFRRHVLKEEEPHDHFDVFLGCVRRVFPPPEAIDEVSSE